MDVPSPHGDPPPLRAGWSVLALPAHPDSLRPARDFVRERVAVAGCHDVVEVAVLLTSELVTHAILQGRAPVVVEVVGDARRGLTVSVADRSCAWPTVPTSRGPRDPDLSLRVVELLSDTWGVEVADDGRLLWFTIGRPAHPVPRQRRGKPPLSP